MHTLIFTSMMDEPNLVVNFRFQFIYWILFYIEFISDRITYSIIVNWKSFCSNTRRLMWTWKSNWNLGKQLRLVFKWISILFWFAPEQKSFWNPSELIRHVRLALVRIDFVFSSYYMIYIATQNSKIPSHTAST